MNVTKIAALIALSAAVACGKKDNEMVDTTTVPGVDTTAGLSVPVTDTVVKTTTTDTIQGEAKRDSVKDATKSKTKTP
jgi:hypothetical protein